MRRSDGCANFEAEGSRNWPASPRIAHAAVQGHDVAMKVIVQAFLAASLTALSAPGNARDLVWSEEFDATALDRSTWNVIGPDLWVNNEQQAYLDDPATIAIVQGADGAEGGALRLQPVFRPGVDPHAERKADFVSGRIDSKGKFDFTFGRAEARIRMPDARGVWPAFWLLGNGPWPDTGEIDIMEYIGEKEWTSVALHGPGYSGDTPLVSRYAFPLGTDVTGWHVYAVEWTNDALVFEVDGQPVYRVTREMVERYGEWRFDNPKYVIINFALGGAYPAGVNRVESPYPGLPQETVDRIKAGEPTMLVDWVRVYAPETPPASGH
jgi:beta-glucanase (GH16 family)